MITYVHHFIVPAAYALLPERLNSKEATAMLLAIGLQESKFAARRQMGDGPARGFWQFELGGGLRGVAQHRATTALFGEVLRELQYPADISLTALHAALEHNDVLACACARLLLWTLPFELPRPHQMQFGWQQYVEAWRPGKPHPDDWPEYFARAWAMVTSDD